MPQRILITSALPYANGPLHFGHIAGAYLPADCYARFQRLLKNDVLYICGSDEYGVAITLSAEMAGRTPQKHVDLFHEINKNLFKQLNFSFDHYSRTTSPEHTAPAHQFFLDLLHNGFIEKRTTDQLYSEQDHRFLADRYVIGECPQCGFANARGDECPECGASYEATDLKNPRSKMTNASLTRKPTEHWFLLLDKFKDRLTEWLENKQWKPNVSNFAKKYIQDLHPRAITRDSSWGVPVPLPDAQGKVLYVWFDAPIGYISATIEWAKKEGDPDRWKKYWFDSTTKLVNFIGKDNIPFHAICFPAMILGQNQPYKLVDELPANEFFKLEGRQFSKSEGWYIDLDDFFARYSADQIRYTIAANAPETADSEFTWKDFQQRCNGELLGKYGNLVNRVLVFAHNNCKGEVPLTKELESIDFAFLKNINELISQIREYYQTFKLRAASQTIMELAQLGNTYFDRKRPWQDAKNLESIPRMEATISCCLECLKALALVSLPIIPDTALRVWNLLGQSKPLADIGWEEVINKSLPTFQKLKPPVLLFQKIEDEQINQEIARLHRMVEKVTEETLKNSVPKSKTTEYSPLKPQIVIEDVQKLDLRVGIILEAAPIPKSRKLLKLKVDLGFDQRTIVAGISQHYAPEALIGKRIVVVANLKPTTLAGVESQGMVLAGTLTDALELPCVQNLPAGSTVS